MPPRSDRSVLMPIWDGTYRLTYRVGGRNIAAPNASASLLTDADLVEVRIS